MKINKHIEESESSSKFYFKGHGRRNFRSSVSTEEAVKNQYTFEDIAKLLCLTPQEVCTQYLEGLAVNIAK